MINIYDNRTREEEKENPHPYISDIRHETGKEFKLKSFGHTHNEGSKDHYQHKKRNINTGLRAERKSSPCLQECIKMHSSIEQEKGYEEKIHLSCLFRISYHLLSFNPISASLLPKARQIFASFSSISLVFSGPAT